MATPIYNCSQGDLIIVINTGLNSCEEYLAEFTAFSPMYNLAWINDLRADTDAAELLPIEDARTDESETLRVDLAKQTAEGCVDWQKFKRYIIKAYDPSLVKIKLDAAGQNYYTQASNENWSAAKTMFGAAKTFMDANLAALTAGSNMPPAFPAAFATMFQNFNDTLKAYEDSKEVILVATQTKIEAYNDIFRRFMPMMLDGQEIFRNNEAVRKQFVFTDVLSRITGPGLAGIRGNITNSTDNQPLPNASITLTIVINTITNTYTATTNAEGSYELNTPSGKYDLAITAEGYTTRNIIDYTIAVGTMHRLDIALEPAPALVES